MRIVGAVENGAACLIEQLIEDAFNRRQVFVKIEVLFFYIKYQGVFGMKTGQRAIALVSFGNEVFAA